MKRFATCWLLAILLTTIAWADATDAGVAMLRDGRFAEAETALSAVLQQPDAPLTASYWRGRARLALERWAAAAEDFRAVLARKPASVPSREGLARCLEQLHRNAEALTEYRALLAAAPDNAEAKAAVERLATPVAKPRPTAPVATTAPAATVKEVVPVTVTPPAAPVGPRIGFSSEGLGNNFASLLTETHLDAGGPQLLDYTFGNAPVDWQPTAGTWQVLSRFACDPSWSFFGGYSLGLASVWNKRRFGGDLAVEAYVSFKHGLPWNPAAWSYRPSDLCLTLFGDGQNPASGYSFIYAGDEASRTMIRKGSTILASTTDPKFLSPSYSDSRPAMEEFHRRWWQLAALRSGRHLTFVIDGQVALEADDPDPLPTGQVAIWTVHNGMMVARVRIAYQQELRRAEPAVVVTTPAPLPDGPLTVASAR